MIRRKSSGTHNQGHGKGTLQKCVPLTNQKKKKGLPHSPMQAFLYGFNRMSSFKTFWARFSNNKYVKACTMHQNLEPVKAEETTIAGRISDLHVLA